MLKRCSNLEFEAIKNVNYHFLSASGLVGFNTYEAETAAEYGMYFEENQVIHIHEFLSLLLYSL